MQPQEAAEGGLPPPMARRASVDVAPSNKKELTIKNLDTGEEFVIGENDPDFEFDTFEITDRTGGGTAGAMGKQKAAYWSWPIYTFLISRLRGDKPGAASSGASEKTCGNVSYRPTPFTKLSSFKFRRELGRGAFGRVLLAEAKLDGKLYALKIISKKNMRTSDKRQAKAERDILHAMNHAHPHPFVAKLKFAFQSENNLYLGMDFIPGGNLRELIKKNVRLPMSWVAFYGCELVLAISHLHSINVLYRDIKPHNVMIDAQGHITLIDFGLSKQDQTNKAMTLVGTPDYSAPEVLKTGVYQIEKHNKMKQEASSKKPSKPSSSDSGSDSTHIGYGKAADWWSLGVMLYEMISGTPAFRGCDLRQTYQKVLFSEVEFKPEEHFTPESRSLLLGLLDREPARRLGSDASKRSTYGLPRDVMAAAFFAGVDWEGVYTRSSDGPWLPEAGKLVLSTRPKSVDRANPTTAPHVAQIRGSGAYTGGEGGGRSRAPSTALSAVAASVEDQAAPLLADVAGPGSDVEPSMPLSGDKELSESGSDTLSTSRHSEVMHLRESLLGQHDGRNRIEQLPDWSFIDENVLVEVSSGGAEV